MNSIAFWNCRGANKNEASLYLKEVIKDHGILFVGLVETKLNAFDKVSFHKIMGADWDFYLFPSDGLSGGIMVLWRSDLASFSVLKETDQCIIGELNVFNKGVSMIAIIYGNKEVVKRRELLGSLQEVSNRKVPFIVGRDFNWILSQEYKRSGRKFVFAQGSKEMVDFLNVNDLHDVGFVGPRFTWCNNKLGGDRILERLDRCLLNSISINASSFIIGKVWRKVFQGSDMEIFNKKCKKELKELFFWSKARIKDFSLEKKNLKEEISQIQEEEASLGWLTDENLWMLRSKVKELNSVLARLNTWWRQRAKAKWIEEGDTNYKSFHSFVNTRRNGKRISQIKNDDGVLTEDPEELHKVFFKYFQNKWKQRSCCTENWPNPLSILDDNDRRSLEIQISDVEILEVIKRLGNNKASGPDGITYSFLKIYWNIIGIDVLLNRLLMVIPKVISEEQEGKDLGIKVASRCQKISHLLYADNVLLLSDAKIKSIKKMKAILNNYCGWTGQRQNLKKSAMIISKTVERRRKKKIKKILEIKVVEELDYLGTKLALRRLKKDCINELQASYEKNLMMVKLYFTLLWISWNNRNNTKHTKKEDSVSVMVANVISLVALDKRQKGLSKNWDVKQSTGLSIDFWHPPPPEWYKINIDAALRSNYGAGIGGIIRDHKGRFVRAFGFYGMHWDIAQLELYSFNSLKDILHNSIDNAKGVKIEGDNKNVIQFLLNLYSKEKKKLGCIRDENFFGL
ncbi:uncharacterized protein LOC110113605, partial [Dendrobium catenatum]|uniref:uncharacterized protein LOC110113605 n=1 Tax=Dendrobium catenatum TaxID=906689 RepID=UPI0009F7383E